MAQKRRTNGSLAESYALAKEKQAERLAAQGIIDERNSRISRQIFAGLGAGIVAGFVSASIIPALPAALGARLVARGTKTKEKTPDGLGVILGWGPLDATRASMAAAWFFATALAIVWRGERFQALTWLGALAFAGWGGWLLYRTRARKAYQPTTEGEKAAMKFTPMDLQRAGLTVPNRATGSIAFPEIVARGDDEHGRGYVEVRLIGGFQTVETYTKHAANLASSWGVRAVEVTSPSIGIVRLTAALEQGGIQGPVTWEPAPAPERVNVVEYVRNLPMGAWVETGAPWSLDISARNFVVGGLPGWGKSSFANALLAHLARHPHVRIAFLDFKNGVEAAPWEARADAVVSNTWESNGQAEALEFLRAALRDMAMRYDRMKKAGVTNAWDSGFLGESEPVKIVVVDECAELFDRSTREASALADEITQTIRRMVQQARAAGYIVMISTQNPTSETLPNSIRSVASTAIAFRVRTDQSMAAILGSSYSPESTGGDPRIIGERGQAVFQDGGDSEPERVQVAWIDNDTKNAVIASSAGYRKTWLDAMPESRTPVPTVSLEKPRDTISDSVRPGRTRKIDPDELGGDFDFGN